MVARVGGRLSPSKFLDRNISHRNAGRFLGPDMQYRRQTKRSNPSSCEGNSPWVSYVGIRAVPRF